MPHDTIRRAWLTVPPTMPWRGGLKGRVPHQSQRPSTNASDARQTMELIHAAVPITLSLPGAQVTTYRNIVFDE
jgi:hypothetical protein